ncbi:jg24798 [Pararge aegeria aegeria]|uniref:Amidophosphoribosyltransferase n=1 Tax=Pararge aegeria aegeria TaxID=348720 RepID=A0A8S4QKZ6_9NEOP|nr:jg24798 [Pararge aegeria aegeria]
MLDEVHEECGVFGISCNQSAAFNSILALHALQHRGQESFGVVTSNNDKLLSYHFQGQVSSVFDDIDEIKKSLPGDCAIGHVRYSTSGSKFGVQPMFGKSGKFGDFAIAHNGNLINISPIREQLIKQECVFQSDIDTEVVVHLTASGEKDSFLESFIYALKQIQGAYSFVAINQEVVIGVRDPSGIRPLVLGKLNGSYVLASETCALDIINAEFIREIEPGELVTISSDSKLASMFPFPKQKSSFCIFEYVYFSRPDSIMENRSIYDTRKEIGRILAKESPPKNNVDMIVPIPDSGIPAAIGYAKHSGLPMELGIIRNHYIGRTFIQPIPEIRKVRIKLKFNANKHILKGKNIILIDDSIVRGSTLRSIIVMLKDAGVKEIHLKISCPPIKHSCFYGIDTPECKDLIAANKSVEEIKEVIGIDSLAFLSIDGLYRAVKGEVRNNATPQYCDACFTGDYPIGQAVSPSLQITPPGTIFETTTGAPKNTAVNAPSAKSAGHGILPNIASKAAPIITIVIIGPPIPNFYYLSATAPFLQITPSGVIFETTTGAPKNTAVNAPSAKSAGHGILPNIASKAAPIITIVIIGPPMP